MARTDRSAPVSVVIPAYCARATILAAIESVAAQTLRPQEVIVVDDGSGDETANEVKALAQNYADGWLQVLVLEKNAGAASARNAGWDRASGEFIAFLDADDAWHPCKIEYQFEYLRDHPDVTLCGHAFRFDNEDGDTAESIQEHMPEAISPLRLILKNPFVTPSVMLRADIPLRFQTGKRHMEDHLLWMEIAMSGYKVVRLAAPLAVIRKAQFGEGGLSADLWAMERGDLHNYWHLHRTGRIGLMSTVLLWVASLLKYGRRLVIVAVRRAATRTRTLFSPQ
ncbi:MAG: glycosyltransferase family 2 protein [Thiobacillus sp.]